MSRNRNYQKFKDGTLPFVQIFQWMTRTPAWCHLSPNARALYLGLKGFYNGSNNGTIGLSVRQAGAILNSSAPTASRAFAELVDHGFIIATAKGIPGKGSGYSKATEWLLTEVIDNRTNEKPTKDFVRWTPATAGDVSNSAKGVAGVKRETLGTISKISEGVSPVKLTASGEAENGPMRNVDETHGPDLAKTAFHPRDTLTSSHADGAAQTLIRQAPPPKGRVRANETAAREALPEDSLVHVSEALLRSELMQKAIGGRGRV